MRISDWSSDVCSSDLLELVETDDDILVADAEEAADLDRNGAHPAGGVDQGLFHFADPLAARTDHLHVVEAAIRDGGTRLRGGRRRRALLRSEEHTSELQSLMRISYAVFCLKKKNNITAYSVITSQQCNYIRHI